MANPVRICISKVRHKSLRKAQVHAQHLNQMEGSKGLVKAYDCVYCYGYHVGHPMNQQARDELARQYG